MPRIESANTLTSSARLKPVPGTLPMPRNLPGAMSAIEPGLASTNLVFGARCTVRGPFAVFTVREVAAEETIEPRTCWVGGGAALTAETEEKVAATMTAAARRPK